MRKYHPVIVSLLFLFVAVAACQKDQTDTPPIASLTLTNAIINGASLRVNSIVRIIPNNVSRNLSVFAQPQNLHVWPIEDSTHPVYTHTKFSPANREIYSLFVAGQSPDIAGVMIREELPYHTDSTCGIRFINLSPNSEPLTITLSTTPAAEVSGLAYLQYTGFKQYPAKAGNTSYVWQIRRSSNNTILTTYSLATPRFANVTLVIRGLMGGSPALGITRVNNDK